MRKGRSLSRRESQPPGFPWGRLIQSGHEIKCINIVFDFTQTISMGHRLFQRRAASTPCAANLQLQCGIYLKAGFIVPGGVLPRCAAQALNHSSPHRCGRQESQQACACLAAHLASNVWERLGRFVWYESTKYMRTSGHLSSGPVAQWIRHRPTEPGIAGSSPAGVISFSLLVCTRARKFFSM